MAFFIICLGSDFLKHEADINENKNSESIFHYNFMVAPTVK